MTTRNKRKIINDPIYGFIEIPFDLAFDVLNHPYFQRLRRINQLGLTYLVYPGTMHTRFQHTLGAMHLMTKALNVLRAKGHSITDEEYQATILAILLHDIGHGPFSHALENSIVPEVNHEALSLLFMKKLNHEFEGKLKLAIDIFLGNYEKSFLHQLVSSQLDVDRLDYLKRDSFYSGVSEGVVGSDRIIKMLNVRDQELVIEAKGIFSIEKFLFARRFMYWQVYLHKTVLAAEYMLLLTLRRAKFLSLQGENLIASTSLKYFLSQNLKINDFESQLLNKNDNPLDHFAALDDNDIVVALKEWSHHSDPVLSFLSDSLITRKLFKIEMRNSEFPEEYVIEIQKNFLNSNQYDPKDIEYFVYQDSISNTPYSLNDTKILILFNDDRLEDIFECSDVLHPTQVSSGAQKYFMIYPRSFNK